LTVVVGFPFFFFLKRGVVEFFKRDLRVIIDETWNRKEGFISRLANWKEERLRKSY